MATTQSPIGASVPRPAENGLGRLASWCYDHRRRVPADSPKALGIPTARVRLAVTHSPELGRHTDVMTQDEEVSTMATDTPRQLPNPTQLSDASPYLPPIEKPKGLRLKFFYWFMRRYFGKAPGWLTVGGARMPLAYTSWGGQGGKAQQEARALAGNNEAGPRPRRQPQR